MYSSVLSVGTSTRTPQTTETMPKNVAPRDVPNSQLYPPAPRPPPPAHDFRLNHAFVTYLLGRVETQGPHYVGHLSHRYYVGR